MHLGVSQGHGYHYGGPQNTDCNMLESILELSHVGKQIIICLIPSLGVAGCHKKTSRHMASYTRNRS